MTPDIFIIAGSAAAGSAGSVWFVFKVCMDAMKEDIAEAKVTANQAHKRIDRHIELHTHD